MSAETTPKMPLTHAGLALGLLVAGLVAGSSLLPALLRWPFYLLAPLVAYLLIALAVSPLRRSLNWFRIGRLDRMTWLASAAIVLVSSATLAMWHEVAQPDVSAIVKHLPVGNMRTMVAAGVLFSVVNALLEEILFRGLLFDALCATYSIRAALAVQAVAFGMFHVQGFPSGAVGVTLAAIYGSLQGALRLYSGGLGACCVTHIAADATIFLLLLRHVA